MKYFFGFLISIGLIVLVVILVIKGVTGGGSAQPQRKLLSSYAHTSSTMEFTVSGPIVGDQQFKSYRIIVSRDQVSLETRQGYENTILDQRTYLNNQESYTNFLRALDVVGFSKGDKESKDTDERGMCADGSRYVMQIKNGTANVQRFWSATCRGLGNFKGNAPAVRKLFSTQVPRADFSKLTNGLQL